MPRLSASLPRRAPSRTGRCRCALLLAALLGLAGCSPLGLLNALVPSGGYERTAGISYGPAGRQQLDVYRPREASGPLPVVVFFYGGRWQSGAREQYAFVAQALASQGFVVVVPDYRLYPQVTFPAFVEDGARAVAWAHQHIARFGGDPRRLHLMGHSAGAHIAMLLTLDAHYLAEQGLGPGALASTVGLGGPYDFLPFTSRDVRALMGPQEGWERTQPIRFVDGSAPPLLLVHGLGDTTVKPSNALRLAARVREAGGCVQLRLYPEAGHLEPLLGLAAPLRPFTPRVLEPVADFLRNPTCEETAARR
jgi:acetyl esterase/lipase